MQMKWIRRLQKKIGQLKLVIKSPVHHLLPRLQLTETSKRLLLFLTGLFSYGFLSSSCSVDVDAYVIGINRVKRMSLFVLQQQVVQKTAATFAPRASTATKNPAVPGTTLYTVFEVQGYVCMLLGGALSFNLIFPSNDPDIWRLMGMWSIWMFTIPSLRARDCSKNEKEALNYLFLLVPLLNVTIPFFWKSFALVWSADTIAFFGMYAWKLGWLQKTE